jgi:hypothetical protein
MELDPMRLGVGIIEDLTIMEEWMIEGAVMIIGGLNVNLVTIVMTIIGIIEMEVDTMVMVLDITKIDGMMEIETINVVIKE